MLPHIKFLGSNSILIGDDMNNIIVDRKDIDLLIEMLEAVRKVDVVGDK